MKKLIKPTALLATLALGLTSQLFSQTPDPTEDAKSANRKETNNLHTSSQLAENLRKGKSQHLVVYGTSLCSPQYSTWVGELQTLIETGFPKLCTVTNSAQPGAASNWGLDNIDARVIALKPDTVLIEFSINDGYTIYKISVADAQKNLETMIEKVR